MSSRRSILALLLVLAILPVIGLLTTPNAHAAPKTTGGTFTVNGAGDLTTANNFITFREAILLANGGTGGDGTSTGLGRTLTDNEKAQLSGCAFSGSTDNWTITGGCGGGITDTIEFSLTVGVTITLGTTALPPVNDSTPTIIDGTAVSPTIDASAVTGTHNGLRILSPGSTVKGLGVAFASLNDFLVAANNTTLSNVWALNAGTNGIYLNSSNNSIVDSAVVGMKNPYLISCSGNSNAGDGIFVDGGVSNTITSSIIECNAGNGITVDNGATGTQMPNNHIGTEIGTGPFFNLGNGGNGVVIQGGAYSNTIGSGGNTFNSHSIIYYNTLDGVLITGTNTTSNTVFGGDIAFNGANGIRINSNAHHNIIGNTTGFGTFVSNNGSNGILLATGAHDNEIHGSLFDALNTKNGIELTGSGTTGNLIQGGAGLTQIFSNTLDGVNERNSADNNKWSDLSIYANGGLGIDKNAANDSANNFTPPFPSITSVISSGGSITINGTATPSGGGITTTVELYANGLDERGYGEGKDSVAINLPVSASGTWIFIVGAFYTPCFTAFQTQDFGGGVYTSSEFGPTNCRLYLPLIMR